MNRPKPEDPKPATEPVDIHPYVCEHGHGHFCTQCLRDSGVEVQRSKVFCHFGKEPLVLLVQGGSFVQEQHDSQGCCVEDWWMDDAPAGSSGIRVWEGEVWWDSPSYMDGESDIHFEGAWRLPTPDELTLVARGPADAVVDSTSTPTTEEDTTKGPSMENQDIKSRKIYPQPEGTPITQGGFPRGLLTLLVQGEHEGLADFLRSHNGIQFWNWFPGVWLLTHPRGEPLSLATWREKLNALFGDETAFLLIDAADQVRSGGGARCRQGLASAVTVTPQ